MEQGGETDSSWQEPPVSLEPFFVEHYEELLVLFEDDHDGNKAFIDHELEEQFPQLRKFTDKLTDGLSARPMPEVAKAAAYRAFHMAYMTTKYVVNDSPQLSFERFFDAAEHPITANHIADFAEAHPAICGLLDRFGRLLDPSGNHKSIADLVAVATFMILEEGEAARMKSLPGQFAEQLDNWDGTIDERPEYSEPKGAAEKTPKSICEQLREFNLKLATMANGEERDLFGNNAVASLNQDWIDSDAVHEQFVLTGDAHWEEWETIPNEDGGEVASGRPNLIYKLVSGESTQHGMHVGFEYLSFVGEPAQIWHKMYLLTNRFKASPSREIDHNMFIHFSGDSRIQMVEEDNEEAAADITPSHPERVGVEMDEDEKILFGSLKQDLEDFALEEPRESVQQLLSKRSDAFYRHLRSTTFRRLPRKQQIASVDRIIAQAEADVGITMKFVELIPEYAYRVIESDEGVEYEPIGLHQLAITGVVVALGMLGREQLEKKAIRRDSDMFNKLTGISLRVVIDKDSALYQQAGLRPGDVLEVPITGQNLGAYFSDEPLKDVA
jgi:hypothetical protein